MDVIDRETFLSCQFQLEPKERHLFSGAAVEGMTEESIGYFWDDLQRIIEGKGARIGFSSVMFVTPLDEEALMSRLEKLAATNINAHLWRFVGQRLQNSNNIKGSMRETEWRANKNAQRRSESAVEIL